MMTERDRIDETSPDMKAELLAKLRAVVPEAFSDGQLDLDRLGEIAGDAVATGPERYGITWHYMAGQAGRDCDAASPIACDAGS